VSSNITLKTRQDKEHRGYLDMGSYRLNGGKKTRIQLQRSLARARLLPGAATVGTAVVTFRLAIVRDAGTRFRAEIQPVTRAREAKAGLLSQPGSIRRQDRSARQMSCADPFCSSPHLASAMDTAEPPDPEPHVLSPSPVVEYE
jgi:hypothetical protein